MIIARLYQNKHFMAIVDDKVGKHYLSILAELYKWGFQCSAWSLSVLSWSRASTTSYWLVVIKGVCLPKDSTLNSCLT